jgi:hypothetical protein
MELASYLAGERWSDDPACTHPLLAALARDVNDYISDAGRAALAGLVPSLIGMAGEDLHIDAQIALLCARSALPVAAATVHAAVRGIARACIPQPDQMLYDLLAGGIDECAVWAGRTPGQGTGRGTAPPAPGREPRNSRRPLTRHCLPGHHQQPPAPQPAQTWSATQPWRLNGSALASP